MVSFRPLYFFFELKFVHYIFTIRILVLSIFNRKLKWILTSPLPKFVKAWIRAYVFKSFLFLKKNLVVLIISAGAGVHCEGGKPPKYEVIFGMETCGTFNSGINKHGHYLMSANSKCNYILLFAGSPLKLVIHLIQDINNFESIPAPLGIYLFCFKLPLHYAIPAASFADNNNYKALLFVTFPFWRIIARSGEQVLESYAASTWTQHICVREREREWMFTNLVCKINLKPMKVINL